MIFGGAPIAGVLVDRFRPTATHDLPLLGILPGFPRPSLHSRNLSILSLLPSNGYCLALLQQDRGLTVGITIGGSSLGGVIRPIVLNELLNTHGVSFGWAIRAVGFIMVPLLFLAIVTVVSPP